MFLLTCVVGIIAWLAKDKVATVMKMITDLVEAVTEIRQKLADVAVLTEQVRRLEKIVGEERDERKALEERVRELEQHRTRRTG